MQRALIRLALYFWTWRRLKLEGLEDVIAADLMTEPIGSPTTTKPAHR